MSSATAFEEWLRGYRPQCMDYYTIMDMRKAWEAALTRSERTVLPGGFEETFTKAFAEQERADKERDVEVRFEGRQGQKPAAFVIEERVTNEHNIEMCDEGHKFAFLEDHPRKDGAKRCPHCMAVGLDIARSSTAGWHQAAMTAGTILGLPGGLGAAEFTQAVQDHDARTRAAIQLLHAIAASKKDVWLLPEHQDRLEAICADIPFSATSFCDWHEDGEDSDTYATGCGHYFHYADGLQNNDVNYCQACGKKARVPDSRVHKDG